jgi:hypothetical protein
MLTYGESATPSCDSHYHALYSNILSYIYRERERERESAFNIQQKDSSSGEEEEAVKEYADVC